MRINTGFPIAIAMAGLLLGGCAQWTEFTQSWEEFSTSFLPTSDMPAEISQAELKDLTAFETAAGPAEPRHPAEIQIEELGVEVQSALADTSKTKTEKEKYFGGLIARDLDIPLIARFAMGRYWKSATADQRKTYLDTFRKFIVQTYSTRLGGINVNRMEVVGAKTLGRKDVLVNSVVSSGGDKTLRAAWRVRRRADRYKILDLTVEGISLALTLRQEFASVLRKQGGVNGLISALRGRTT